VFDIAILGAGPVGLTLALALAGEAGPARARELRVALVGPSAGRTGFRPIVLAEASRWLLRRLTGKELPATPIDTIEVSRLRGFGRARLEASDAGLPALGHVLDYPDLVALLDSSSRALAVPRLEGSGRVTEVGADSATVFVERESASETIEARLVVHAEGGATDNASRRKNPLPGNPEPKAIVCRLSVTPRSEWIAHERFAPEGPLALLPIAGDFGLVWCMSPARAERLATQPEAEFIKALRAEAGPRLGEVNSTSGRQVVALRRRKRETLSAARQVFIGNAARQLHPVAGQGLNLALRDLWALAGAIAASADPGSDGSLAQFASARRADAALTGGVTDALAQGLSGHGAMPGFLFDAGLAVFDALPPLRRFFARRMIFGRDALP
jgi:2-octaprenyl-6-methoxyphenol hydroxylase